MDYVYAIICFMKKIIIAAIAAACCLSSSTAKGDEKNYWLPLGISLITPPIQLPSPNHSVFGVMLNFGYGQVEDLSFLDIGVINNVTGVMSGLELAPINIADTCVGLQVGAINVTDKTVGIQLGVINYTNDLHGLQLGAINMSMSGGALVFPIINFGF